MNFEITFNTKWSDFDPNRHMRHTAYNDYAAEVRVRFFQKQGLSIDQFAKLGSVQLSVSASSRLIRFEAFNFSKN